MECIRHHPGISSGSDGYLLVIFLVSDASWRFNEGDPLRYLVCDPNDLSSAECISGVLGFIDLDFGLGFVQVCTDTNRDGRCSPNDDLFIKRVAVDGAFKTPGLRNVDFSLVRIFTLAVQRR